MPDDLTSPVNPELTPNPTENFKSFTVTHPNYFLGRIFLCSWAITAVGYYILVNFCHILGIHLLIVLGLILSFFLGNLILDLFFRYKNIIQLFPERLVIIGKHPQTIFFANIQKFGRYGKGNSSLILTLNSGKYAIIDTTKSEMDLLFPVFESSIYQFMYEKKIFIKKRKDWDNYILAVILIIIAIALYIYYHYFPK